MRQRAGASSARDGRSVKRALTSLALLAATLAFLEGALSLLCIESKTVRLLLTDTPSTIADPTLGVRLNRDYPDHDMGGFRNSSTPKSSDVVALGDSQTYGVGVLADESWPHQLSELSSKSVYNMGVPSYGPVQSLALMRGAMSFHPRWVIEAVYSGNDLWDAYYRTYATNYFADLRSHDPVVMSALDAAELKAPMNEQFPDGPGLGDSNPPSLLRRFLAQHSSLWGLLRAVKAVAMNPRRLRSARPDARWADVVSQARTSGGRWFPFEQGPVRTVLTPQYRLAALDLDDARIREGLRVSNEVIQRMFATAQHDGARFIVVLIPTKELVFLDTFGNTAPAALIPLARLRRKEHEMWEEFKNELGTNGIPYVDALPALRDALTAGDSPYPIDSDGHPNARGHRAIAGAIWSHLRRLEDGKELVAAAP